MKKINFTKEFLHNEYIVLDKSVTEIARENNCYRGTVLDYLKKFGLFTNKKSTKGVRSKLFKDISNQRFDYLEVHEIVDEDIYGNPLWECKCNCGNVVIWPRSKIVKNCFRSCGCSSLKLSKLIGEISSSTWHRIKGAAKIRNIPLLVDKKDLWELFLKQNQKCALTGLKLTFGIKYKDRAKGTASLDRIDSKGIYELKNVQWVHKDVNVMKQDFPEDYLKELCRLIIQYDETKGHEETLTDDIYLACNG